MSIQKLLKKPVILAVTSFLLLISMSAAAQGGLATTIDLTITGGPLAGTYHTTSDEITCSYGLIGEDAWGNQYSIETEDPTTFSSLQLIVPNTAEAAIGTNEFLTTVSFGSLVVETLDFDTSYTINTGTDSGTDGGEGQGTVIIEDHGDSAVVTINGTTEEGIGIEAVIQCHQVMRFASNEREEEATPNGSINLSIGEENYAVQTTDDVAACEPDFSEEGDLYYSYYSEEGYSEEEDTLYNVEVLVYDLEAAREGSPDLYLSVNDQTHYLDTTSEYGTGTVAVQQNGDMFVITVDATLEGTPIQATVECQMPQ
jgi:hypothetical protein